MTIIEIEEKKIDMLSENVEKGLRYMGKAMQILDECMEEAYGEREGSYGNRYYGNRYGEREGGRSMMGNRGGYGNRYGERGGYGNKEGEDWEDYEEMNERRGVRGSGRGRGR